MQATLNVDLKILAFADGQVNSNPRLRFVDWLRSTPGLVVENVKTEAYRILAGQTVEVFNGTRTTTLDATTAFSLTLLSTSPSSYRIAWTGGTSPTLRTGRSITGSGTSFTFSPQVNATLLLQSSVAKFGSVQVGDEVFIPHTNTGDAGNVISVLNSGYWVVLAVTDTSNIVLSRPAGQDFSGVSEVVLLTDNSQLRIYSAAGVQIGDSVDITAGFALTSRRTFEVIAVTDSFIEFVSSTPLPNQTAITPNASGTGMIFYSNTKIVLYVESTQEVVVRVNGDTGDFQRTSPLDSSDPLKPAMYFSTGPKWSLSIYNRSASTTDVTVIHAE